MFDQFEKLAEHEKASFKFADDIESDQEIVNRFNMFLREVAVGYRNKTILVVTHGGMMRSLLIHFGFATYEQMKFGAVKNTAFIKLLSDGSDYFIEKTFGIELHYDEFTR
jgi:broad specificity phosphatase PhoE